MKKSDLKTGMIVKCVNNKANEGGIPFPLTIGKEYPITRNDTIQSCYSVINDRGNEQWYPQELFEVTEWNTYTVNSTIAETEGIRIAKSIMKAEGCTIEHLTFRDIFNMFIQLCERKLKNLILR